MEQTPPGYKYTRLRNTRKTVHCAPTTENDEDHRIELEPVFFFLAGFWVLGFQYVFHPAVAGCFDRFIFCRS